MPGINDKTIPIPTPVFHAQFLSAYDADTCRMKLRRNFGDESQKTLRLLEVNCAEMRAKDREEKDAAIRARNFALKWFAEGSLGLRTPTDVWPFVVQVSDIHEKYGRTLGFIWRKSDGDCLNSALIREGHGEYMPLMLHLAHLKAT